MKKIYSLFFALATTIFLNAQNLQWVSDMGAINSTTAYGYTTVLATATDTANNVYAAGHFSGTVDFDPDTSQVLKTSAGLDDMFIAKYNDAGTLVWVKQIGGIRKDQILDLDINQYGSLVMTGTFAGYVDFDPGISTFFLSTGISSSDEDVFILRLTPNGVFIWAKKIGSGDLDQGYRVKFDKLGNIYVSGLFSGTVDFDPSTSTYSLSAGAFKTNAFVMKLGASGIFKWARAFTSSDYVYSRAMTVDDSSNVYVAGMFDGTVNITSTLQVFTASGFYDMFVTKLDALGNFKWAKQFGGSGGEVEAYDLTVDSLQNTYLTGNFSGTIDFNPSLSSHNLQAVGIGDIFILKLLSNGGLNWVKQIDGDSRSCGHSICVAADGVIYTAGMFSGFGGSIVDFDPDPNAVFLLSAASYFGYDGYMHALDMQGNFLFVKRIGGIENDLAYHIQLDKNGDLIVAGTYQNTANFNHPSVFNKTTLCGNNWPWGYVAKYDACFSRVTTITACDSFATPNGSYTFYASGTYTDSFVNTSCTSYLTYIVQINQSKHDSINASTCDSYTSPSGKFIWQTSGNYIDTLISSSGCDSILNINLMVTNIDTSVSRVGTTFTALHPNASYQWLDCSNGFSLIVGANSQSYTVASNGMFAVEITENGCSDTSSCFVVSGIGISNMEVRERGYEIFPNPTSENVTIRFDAIQNNVKVEVFDMLGSLFSSERFRNANEIPVELPLVSGVYFIKLNLHGNTEVIKIIRQ